jgi:transcriptional regulator with GAF, ATPase, and Fis domain
LEHLVERSVILANDSTLEVLLPEKSNNCAIDTGFVVGDFEEQERIVVTLRQTNGRVSGPNGAAFRLGLKRGALLDRMKRLGIDAREVKRNVMYARDNAAD